MKMNEAIRHAVSLDAGTMLRVLEGRGLRLLATEGQVWVTQEGCSRDAVLNAGESLCIENDGLTLVQALRRSAISLLAARDRDRPEPTATFGILLPVRFGA
jgi:hypothetical protein